MSLKKRRICVVTTGRADYSKLRSVLHALQREESIELLTIVAGSHLLRNYDQTVELIREDGFPISYTAYIELDGKVPVTMAKSTGLAVSEFATAFDNLKPDMVVVHGDRYEALAAAVAASLMNLFVAHLEGGEVSGTIDEHLRHAITKLAHLHLVTTERARDVVVQLGEHPSMVQCVGCPAIDVLLGTETLPLQAVERLIRKRHVQNDRPFTLYQGFLLCIEHPVTTEYEQAAKHALELLLALGDTLRQVIMLWPNIDAGADDISRTIRLFQALPEGKFLHVFKNFAPDIFYNLMRHAGALVGNSSSGIREASYFGTPVVNIGSRQQGRAHGKNVLHADQEREHIARAIKTQLSHGRYPPEHLYGSGGAGAKIATALKTADIGAIQKRLSYGIPKHSTSVEELLQNEVNVAVSARDLM